MNQYYVFKPDGIQEGPYPEDMVRACLAEGIYPENTKIWCEGMESWQDISLLAQQAAPAYIENVLPTNDEITPPVSAADAPPATQRNKSAAPPNRSKFAVFLNNKVIAGLSAVCLLGLSLGIYLTSSSSTEPSAKENISSESDCLAAENSEQLTPSSEPPSTPPEPTVENNEQSDSSLEEITSAVPDFQVTKDNEQQEISEEDRIRLLAVNITDKRGISVLHNAAHQGNPHVVNRLIQAGANVNAISGNSEQITPDINKHSSHLAFQLLYANHTSPLIYAALGGAADCMELLIKAGADVNFQDEMGNTALHAAAANGFADCVQVLIKAGADINKQTNMGLTPLHFTMKYDAADCMELLIKAGADINTSTKFGELPLLLAVTNNAVNCTKVLLQAGADPEAKGSNDIAPCEYISFDVYCPACLPMKRKESLLLIFKAMAVKRAGKPSSGASKKTRKSTSNADNEKNNAALDSALRKCPADLQDLFAEHKEDMSRLLEDYNSPRTVIQMYEKAARLLQEEIGNQIPDWEVVHLVVTRVLHTL